MLQNQRHQAIIQYLSANDHLTLQNAANMLDAATATIRRDFTILANQNLVERFRGGVRPKRQTIQGMLPFALRKMAFSKEKEALAKCAASLIKNGNVIFIDAGTTTFHMAMCLPNIELRVITNSLRLATALEEQYTYNSGLEIYLTGGFLYTKSGILLGPNTEAALKQYHADWTFLSIGGINEDGITNTNELVTEAERIMIQNARKVAVLADPGKIGKTAMCRICGLDRIDFLITTPCPENEETLQKFREKGLKIITA